MKCAVVMLKQEEFEPRREEILQLAKTAGYEMAKLFVQSGAPRAKFFIGRGKVEEIKEFVKGNYVELIIFENYLTSRQVLNLEAELRVPVIDKFDLILDVFEKHAQSREAKMQIELARLKRKLPYIKLFAGKRVRADHPGFGSTGEYVVHSTLAALNARVKRIENQLEKFQARVQQQGRRRQELGKIVSLAGYTNAGKTTLFNALTGAGMEAKDELFTTLQTKTAKLDGGIYVSDTIGFIRNLPHELIYAFRATLGEVKNSSAVLLVLDASEEMQEFRRKKEICEKMLAGLLSANVQIIYVLNKIDVCEDLEDKQKLFSSAVAISAQRGIGIEKLKRAVEGAVKDYGIKSNDERDSPAGV